MRIPLGGLFDSEAFCVVLDAIGHRYGMRPSELWGITDPEHRVLAVAFDGDVLRKANAFEARYIEDLKAGRKVDPVEREDMKLQSKMAWAKFARTLPEGPLKEKAMEKFGG